MKIILCAILFGLALANDTKDITLDGTKYSGDDLTSWLNDCTNSVNAVGCSDCSCTAATFDDDVVITVSGGEQDLDKLEDHVEEDGISIAGETYAFIEELEEEDGTMTLIVTISIFLFMCVCVVGFFACSEWPNSEAKKAARAAKRKKEEAEKKAAAETKAKLTRPTSTPRY